MKIYFAGSISAGREDAELYAELISLLVEHGEVLTEHIGHAMVTDQGEALPEKVVHDRDLKWLAESDVLVAEATIPSLGVGYEIGKAEEWGKRVLVLAREGGKRLSPMVSGAGESIQCHYWKDLDEAKAIFQEFFAS